MKKHPNFKEDLRHVTDMAATIGSDLKEIRRSFDKDRFVVSWGVRDKQNAKHSVMGITALHLRRSIEDFNKDSEPKIAQWVGIRDRSPTIVLAMNARSTNTIQHNRGLNASLSNVASSHVGMGGVGISLFSIKLGCFDVASSGLSAVQVKVDSYSLLKDWLTPYAHQDSIAPDVAESVSRLMAERAAESSDVLVTDTVSRDAVIHVSGTSLITEAESVAATSDSMAAGTGEELVESVAAGATANAGERAADIVVASVTEGAEAEVLEGVGTVVVEEAAEEGVLEGVLGLLSLLLL